jgi:hypothetical protein
MKIYNKTNFHKHTFCVFNEVTASEIENLKVNYTSKSGSYYLFTEEGVFRKSNHWGRAANCKWRLSTAYENPSRTKIGFAKWNCFYPINEIEKLYYIDVNFEEKKVQYNHKNTSDEPNLFLRNATETAKRVKEIRHLFLNDKKLHYWETNLTFNELFKLVIRHLIDTNLNLLEIKKAIA